MTRDRYVPNVENVITADTIDRSIFWRRNLLSMSRGSKETQLRKRECDASRLRHLSSPLLFPVYWLNAFLLQMHRATESMDDDLESPWDETYWGSCCFSVACCSRTSANVRHASYFLPRAPPCRNVSHVYTKKKKIKIMTMMIMMRSSLRRYVS